LRVRVFGPGRRCDIVCRFCGLGRNLRCGCRCFLRLLLCFDLRRRRFFYGDGRAATSVVSAIGADRHPKAPFDSDGNILIDRARVRLFFTDAQLG
jgi:hypothetical protein